MRRKLVNVANRPPKEAESRWRWMGWVLLLLVSLGLVVSCDRGLGLEGYEATRTEALGLALSVPQWSTDGSRIMFEEMSVDAPDGTRLDWLSSEILRPNLAPDGSRAVYAVDPDRDRFGSRYSIAIETSNLDGSDRKRLTDDQRGAYLSPAWSPDGASIAYVRRKGVYTMAADGSDVRWLIRFLGTEDLSREEDLKRGERIQEAIRSGAPIDPVDIFRQKHQAGPVWSPDGKALAVVVREWNYGWGRPVRYVLIVAASNGSNPTRVFATTPQRLPFDQIGWPSWSPDGQELAFIRFGAPSYDSETAPVFEAIDAPRGLAPYTIRRDGSELREVAPGIPQVGWNNEQVLFPSASWSPDGTQILFTLGDGHLYVAQANGGGYRQIGEGSYASWSSDGSRIAVGDPHGESSVRVLYYGVRLAGTEQYVDPETSVPHDHLWTMAPDGSDRRVLVRRDEEGALVAANPAPEPWYRFW